MAGYSPTPLVKKLGIKPGYLIHILNEPKSYWKDISPLPEEVKALEKPSKEIDFLHWFVADRKTFEKGFLKMKKLMKKDGMMWVSWPKKSSGVASDLDENIIRDFGLKNGLVDVKVCAVDETWSGLKFVYRLADR